MSEDPHQWPPPPSHFANARSAILRSALTRSTLARDANRELASILSTPSPHRRALPTELILQILSHPSSWVLAWSDTIVRSARVDSAEGSKRLLRTPPLTERSARLLRQVVFTIRSNDQGWSSYPTDHGTFENSWTWFDAAVESQNADSLHMRWHRLQANKHAVRKSESYTIPLLRGEGILDDLKVGDQILLVACARYGGWVNNIKAAGIEMWEADDFIGCTEFGDGPNQILNAEADGDDSNGSSEEYDWSE
ncbi:hypothetical protein MMC22_003833 [Lobaria immixta]|nr:hypothetical protein [Lobaria immixta]